MRKAVMHLTVFSMGGVLYCLCELVYRGRTHGSMFLLGGLCFCLVGLLGKVLPRRLPLPLRLFVFALAITCCEFLTGLVVNRWLQLGVWDYSTQRFSLLGQICPAFFGVWFLLSYVALVLYRAIERYAFGVPKKI